MAANSFRGLVNYDQQGSQIGRGQIGRGQIGTVISRSIGVARNLSLTGITRDSVGALLGICVTELLQSGGDILTQSTVSDAGGNFTFTNPGSGPFFIRSYKDGAPNLAGVTDRNLIAV
jgi:hypothetical protein